MLAARMGEPTKGADTYRSVRTGHRGLRTAVIVELDLATVLVRVTVSADTTFQGSHFSQQLRIPSHVRRFRDRLCINWTLKLDPTAWDPSSWTLSGWIPSVSRVGSIQLHPWSGTPSEKALGAEVGLKETTAM